jgi:hypothetical protein
VARPRASELVGQKRKNNGLPFPPFFWRTERAGPAFRLRSFPTNRSTSWSFRARSNLGESKQALIQDGRFHFRWDGLCDTEVEGSCEPNPRWAHSDPPYNTVRFFCLKDEAFLPEDIGDDGDPFQGSFAEVITCNNVGVRIWDGTKGKKSGNRAAECGWDLSAPQHSAPGSVYSPPGRCMSLKPYRLGPVSAVSTDTTANQMLTK